MFLTAELFDLKSVLVYCQISDNPAHGEVNSMTILKRLTGLFSVTLMVLFCSHAGVAQDGVAPGLSGIFTLDHPFLAEDGSIVVEGQLQALDGATAIIKCKGKEMRFNLSQFSKKEQTWIRKQIALIKKRNTKRPEINKLALGLGSNKPTIIIKTCNRLKTYGPAASHIAPQLDPLVKSSDSRTRTAAFICLLSIAEDNPLAVRRIVDEINRNQPLTSSFESIPAKLLSPFSRFEERGLPYLGAVAFAGQLNVPAADSSEIEAQTDLDAVAGKTRIAACNAIAKSQAEEEAANLLLQVLEAEALSESETNQVAEVFQCLGKLGFQSDRVLDAIQEHVSEAPEEAKTALEEISKANQENEGK